MHTFKDTAGQVWQLAINTTQIKRVKAFLGINLYEVAAAGMEDLHKLVDDPIQFTDILYVLCKDETDLHKISNEDFGRRMSGDVWLAATDAFLDEIVDFFRDPRVRATLKNVIKKANVVRERLLTHGEMLLNEINPETEAQKLIDALTVKNLKHGSGNVPELSA